jgi:hypothetical protein
MNKDYQERVAYLADNKICEDFENTDAYHALIVFVELFKHSKETVHIFAGSLDSYVANEERYVNALSDFIERGGKVKILLNEFDSEQIGSNNRALVDKLVQYSDKPISIKQTTIVPYLNGKQKIHFAVGDSTSYRVENDIMARKAFCNFNNVPFATKLVTAFDKAFDDGEKSESLNLKELANNLSD